ncbi:MAG TPA: hypothetical protein PKN36_10025 [bacterium]|nr:hypothetical protein [bacterium]
MEENIKEILSEEEWNKYQEMTVLQSERGEISKKYWEAVGPGMKTKNPVNKEQAQYYKTEWEKYDEIIKDKSRTFWEIIAPQQEKVFLLAIELDRKEPEAFGWIFAKSFLDIKSKPETFWKAYLYFNKYESRMQRDALKDSIRNGLLHLMDEFTIGEENDRIKFAANFLQNSQNISQEKAIAMEFAWDIWSRFFNQIEKMDNKSKIYEKMNQQAVLIIETLKTAKTDVKLSEKVDKVLQKFLEHYSRKDLPVEFLKSPSISNVKEKLP